MNLFKKHISRLKHLIDVSGFKLIYSAKACLRFSLQLICACLFCMGVANSQTFYSIAVTPLHNKLSEKAKSTHGLNKNDQNLSTYVHDFAATNILMAYVVEDIHSTDNSAFNVANLNDLNDKGTTASSGDWDKWDEIDATANSDDIKEQSSVQNENGVVFEHNVNLIEDHDFNNDSINTAQSTAQSTNSRSDIDSSNDSYDNIENINDTNNATHENRYVNSAVTSSISNENETEIDISAEQVPLNAIAPETVHTFVEVIDTIRHEYVRPVNDEALFQYAISGMLQRLDSHAEYLTPNGYEKLKDFTDGQIAEVGLSAAYDDVKQAWIIDSIAPNSSAEQAGLKLGERLIAIKNIELQDDMTPQDIDQLLSGIAGSHVRVKVVDSSSKARTVVMERNITKDNKIEVVMQNGVAIVRLPIFQTSTKNQLIHAFREINQPISGVVLDVRNNPGGVLSAAIDVASLFIKDQALIQVKNRTNSSQTIKPNGMPYLNDVPVVLLQNRYSASASEVLASSLKSNHRALIVGETSFGKGTVQEVIPLQAGGAIKLTVAEYFDANGNPIDGIGIKPDIELIHDGANWQQLSVTILADNYNLFPIYIDFGEEYDIGDY